MTLDERLAAYMDREGYDALCGARVLQRYRTEADQRAKGDVQVQLEESTFNVEEKANCGISQDCLIELLQAIEHPWSDRRTRGWWFDLHECDWLLHSYFAEREDVAPSKLVLLDWKPLRLKVIHLLGDPKKGGEGKQYKTRWVPAGFGITLCMYVPYRDINGCVLQSMDCSMCGQGALL